MRIYVVTWLIVSGCGVLLVILVSLLRALNAAQLDGMADFSMNSPKWPLSSGPALELKKETRYTPTNQGRKVLDRFMLLCQSIGSRPAARNRCRRFHRWRFSGRYLFLKFLYRWKHGSFGCVCHRPAPFSDLVWHPSLSLSTACLICIDAYFSGCSYSRRWYPAPKYCSGEISGQYRLLKDCLIMICPCKENTWTS